MKDDKEKTVTVENEGGKGNPNHVPAGDPNGKGGQFTSKEGVSSGSTEDVKEDDDSLGVISLEDESQQESSGDAAFNAALKAFIARKKQQYDAEAKKVQDSFSSELSEETKKYYLELARDDKVALLFNSPIGYDKKKLKSLTDEQLNALLMSEAVINIRPQLEQQLIILEKKKKDIDDSINEKLSQNNIEGYTGIWKGYTARPADWKGLKESGSLQKKYDYYNEVLANSEIPVEERIKAKMFLAKLQQFEKDGQEYENIKSQVQLEHLDELESLESQIGELSSKIKNLSNDSPTIQLAKEYQEKFLDAEATYSQARKNAATWITSKWIQQHPEYKGLSVYQASIQHFGDRFEKMWQTMTAKERSQLIDYTGGGFSKYNKPLRGLSHSGWEGWGFAEGVTALTNAIDKCVWDEDIWVQRGIGDSAMFKLPGKDNTLKNLSQLTPTQLNSLVGTTFKDNGFYSAGAGKGTGFSGTITLNTYCPRGTKMAYMNTHGHYAHGSENEMILQRGYSYRITKIEKDAYGHFYVDCEVILGSDSSKIVDKEELAKIGSKHLY